MQTSCWVVSRGGHVDQAINEPAVKVPYRLVNSAVAFACALYIMVTLHEFAHAVAGLALGLRPVLYASSVDYLITGSASEQITTALAGPLFSLVSGLLILALPPRGGAFARLFVLWLGLQSCQEFFGYLITGPFVRVGDIGQALSLLAAPGWVYALCFLAGWAGTFWLGRVATQHLLVFTDPQPETRAPQLRQLGLFAWLLGAAVTIALSASRGLFTALGLFEALGSLSSGIFLFLAGFYMRRLDVAGRRMPVSWPWAGITLLITLALLRHFALGPGIHLS